MTATLLLLLACADPPAGKPADPDSPAPEDTAAQAEDTAAQAEDTAAQAEDTAAQAEDTAPPEEPPPVVRFVAMGDGGEGNADQYANAAAVAEVCAQRGCDLVLYLGDNFYDDGVASVDDDQFQDKFELPYAGVDLPFYVVLGNHDYGELPIFPWKADHQVEYSDRSDKWHMPDRYYSFIREHVQFFGLDTNEIFIWGGADQQSWFQGELAASTASWRVAYGHHPYISNGQHGNAGEYEGLEWLPVANGASVRAFMDAHLCGQVDLYLAGHDHNRQWLHPTCGTEFIVSGAAAKTTDLEGRGNATYFEDDQAEGFFWIQIEGDTLTGVVYDLHGNEQFSRTVTRSAR